MEAFLLAHLPTDLVKLDRPMIESPDFVMLDHSLCTCYMTTWSV